MGDKDCPHTNWSWQNHYHGSGSRRYNNNNKWKRCNDCGHTWDNMIEPAPERD